MGERLRSPVGVLNEKYLFKNNKSGKRSNLQKPNLNIDLIPNRSYKKNNVFLLRGYLRGPGPTPLLFPLAYWVSNLG